MSPLRYREVSANGASVYFGPRKSAWLWPLEGQLAASCVKAMDAVEALLLTQNGFMESWTRHDCLASHVAERSARSTRIGDVVCFGNRAWLYSNRGLLPFDPSVRWMLNGRRGRVKRLNP